MPDQPNGDGDGVAAGVLFGELKRSTTDADLDEHAAAAQVSDFERVVQAATSRFGASSCQMEHERCGFVAVFSTAHCTVECGFALQQESRQRRWHVRLGGHYGEVLRNDFGDAVGATVHEAAGIQSAADAASGQFLVSDVVPAVVRDRVRHIRFESRAPMPGFPPALAVLEVLPARESESRAAVAASDTGRAEPPVRSPTTPARRHAGRWVVGAVGLAVVLAAVVILRSGLADLGVWKHPPAAPNPVAPYASANTIAVMEFENQRANDVPNDWYAKALQTAFNTELSKIPQLSVIAPEIIQHAARDAGLDRVAAARELGVSRFVTGSFAVLGNTIRIDAHIVDAVNGFQEAAENVEGLQDEFFSLQKQLALATLDHFRVRLTQEQETSLRKMTNSRLDKYLMLLDAEGVTAGPPTHDTQPRESGERQPAGEPPAHGDEQSWLLPLRAWGVASAQAPPADAAAALQVLEEYRRAHESGDLDRLASLYVAFPESQRRKVTKYLRDVAQLRVEFADVQVQQRGDELAISYTRRDRFVDKETGEPVSLEVRLTKFLVNDGGSWKFVEAE